MRVICCGVVVLIDIADQGGMIEEVADAFAAVARIHGGVD